MPASRIWSGPAPAARASETVEATSPAKRDYAARATAADIERAFTDACDEAGCAYDNEALLQAISDLKMAKEALTFDARWAVNVLLETIAKKFDEWDTYDLWKSDAASTVRGFKHDLTKPPTEPMPTDSADTLQAMAGPTQETGKAAEVAHPWYGPCDALAEDGACAECIKVAAAEPTREEIAAIIEPHAAGAIAHHGRGNASTQAVRDYDAALIKAAAILALKPRGGQTREEIEEDDPEVAVVARAIAENGFTRPWDDFLPVNVFDADQSDLIEYAKAAVAAMRLIAMSKPRGEPAREGGE